MLDQTIRDGIAVRAAVFCKDERLRRLLVTELALCGVSAVPEGESCVFWLADLDEGFDPARLPEDNYLLCWSRRPREAVAPDLPTEDRVCFLHRPFSLSELELCIRRLSMRDGMTAVLPEAQALESGESGGHHRGPRVLPLEKGVVAVDGEAVLLTPKEWALFACLWDRQGRPVSKTVLWEALSAVCEDGVAATNTLEVYICHLRRKLEKPIAGRIITTIRGKGYRLDVP